MIFTYVSRAKSVLIMMHAFWGAQAVQVWAARAGRAAWFSPSHVTQILPCEPRDRGSATARPYKIPESVLIQIFKKTRDIHIISRAFPRSVFSTDLGSLSNDLLPGPSQDPFSPPRSVFEGAWDPFWTKFDSSWLITTVRASVRAPSDWRLFL